MQRVLFIDVFCPKPYLLSTLEQEAIGGTEATVIRVAKDLAKTHDVSIYQHNRKASIEEGGVKFLRSLDGQAPFNTIITLRSLLGTKEMKAMYPSALVMSWLHDLTRLEDLVLASQQDTDYQIIAVSDFHKTHILDRARSIGFNMRRLKVKTIFNPIDDDLKPNQEPYDRNKLVFFSSPHKGLERALEVFKHARSFNPDFKLYVANPGYLRCHGTLHDNVVNTGPVSHSEIMGHVRSSLCVLYPNTVFPETFGLVMAEANAVGTPVLTHSLGASHEVLEHPAQFIDCRSNKEVIDKLMHWHKGYRPTVRADSRFRLSQVMREWRKVIA